MVGKSCILLKFYKTSPGLLYPPPVRKYNFLTGGDNRIPYINCQAQFFNYNCSSIKHRFSEFLPTKCRAPKKSIWAPTKKFT